MARMKVSIGAKMKMKRLAPVGTTVSLTSSFKPSANG